MVDSDEENEKSDAKISEDEEPALLPRKPMKRKRK